MASGEDSRRAEAKAALRRKARERRARAHRRLGAVAARRIAELGSHLIERLGHARGGKAVVAGYHPIGAEIDPLPLMTQLAARGHTLALPVLAEGDGPLVFRLWRPGDPLERGRHDIAEPRAERPEVVPDIVLVPLLAFDARGGRLGHGGGHYDRTLAALRARALEGDGASPGVLAIGLAYAEQGVDSLPLEPHDQPLDLVLTPEGVRDFAP